MPHASANRTYDPKRDLSRLTVRPIAVHERDQWDRMVAEHHYLHSPYLVGDALRYVAAIDAKWVALLGWAVSALKCKARDRWIRWSERQKRQRLKLVVNNARFLILPGCRVPNLASKSLALNCRRLAADWRAVFGHPVLLAETFVDPARYRGTCYLAAGWTRVGTTRGYGRRGARYYHHGDGKLVFVKSLWRDACKLLADPQPHPELLTEDRSMDVLSMPILGAGNLYDTLKQITDYRAARGQRYRQIAGLLTIAAAAVLAGQKSYVAIAQWAQTLPETILRALGCTYSKVTGRYRAPSESTLRRAISKVDAEDVDRVVGNWLLQQGISLDDNAIAIDGKTLRGSYGRDGKRVHLLSALTHREGIIFAQQEVDTKTNEIPAARELLEPFDVRGSMVTLDALHTQVKTADYIVEKKGRIIFSS